MAVIDQNTMAGYGMGLKGKKVPVDRPRLHPFLGAASLVLTTFDFRSF